MNELVFKICAVAAVSSLAALLLKSREPELSMLLTLCTAAVILSAAFRLSSGIKEIFNIINKNTDISYVYITPVFKCALIGIAVRLSSSLCSDSSQKTLSEALELCGALCALTVSMPVLTEFISVICKLV